MKTAITVELKPFAVPEYVTGWATSEAQGIGLYAGPSFPLCELEREVLASLCDEFRAAVFLEAGKEDKKALEKELIRYINIYTTYIGGLHPTRELADEVAGSSTTRVGCKKVIFIEGEWDD